MKAARIFQLTALILVVVSVVQVGYWLVDLLTQTLVKVEGAQRLYGEQIAAGRALLAAGVPPAKVQALFADLEIHADAGDTEVRIAPQVSRQLAEEQQHRSTQYLWEGGFFLLALCACIAVIWMALRAEAQVIKEQESFLALVSHQFKTPLASLQLSLETMTLRTLTPEQSRTLIDRMLSDLQRMEIMVAQILDGVRLSRGRVDLKSEPVPLAGAVSRVVMQYQERATNDRISIETEVPADLQVLGDPLAIDVVVRNLVENALAAVAPVGGGKIALTSRRAGSTVELTIRDSGVGFRQADQAKLFEKFSRLHPGAGSSYYGTGLGLYIVKRLMQLLGGSVTARSEGLGRGSEFVLTWPSATALAAPVAAEPS